MQLTDFYVGNSKNFTVTITLNDSSPDLTNDTVSFIMKSTEDAADSAAVLTSTASGSAAGVATFSITPAQTAVDPATYWYEIRWVRSTGAQYTLENSQVKALARTFDT